MHWEKIRFVVHWAKLDNQLIPLSFLPLLLVGPLFR